MLELDDLAPPDLRAEAAALVQQLLEFASAVEALVERIHALWARVNATDGGRELDDDLHAMFWETAGYRRACDLAHLLGDVLVEAGDADPAREKLVALRLAISGADVT